MADVTLNIRHNADQATSSVKSLSNAMGSFASNSKKAATSGTAAANGFKKIGQACLSAGRSATKGASGLSKFVSSIGRIAFYRAIRSAIRYVTDSFKQGLEAAYNWSKEQGGANAKLAAAMDNLSAASGRMKLQLGAAFGGLITAIEPILIRIINLVTAAADAITRFFAVLNGGGYYKKAVGSLNDLGSAAGGAGKQVKGLLASWDELNVIGKESGGGGGGSNSTDYSGMYEWADAESDWANLFASGDFFGIGAKIGDALGDVAQKITNFLKKPEVQNFGKNLADALNGAVSNPENFSKLGEAAGTFVGTVVKNIKYFLENVNWEDVKEALKAFAAGFKKGLEEALGEEFDTSKPYYQIAWEWFLNLEGVQRAVLSFKMLFNDIKISWLELKETILEGMNEFPDWIKTGLGWIGFDISDSLENTKQALADAKEEADALAKSYDELNNKDVTVEVESEVKNPVTTEDVFSSTSFKIANGLASIFCGVNPAVEQLLNGTELFESGVADRPSSGHGKKVGVGVAVVPSVGTSEKLEPKNLFTPNSGVTSPSGNTLALGMPIRIKPEVDNPVNVNVGLKKDGWDTVSLWVDKNYSGGSVWKAVELWRGNFTTAQKWVDDKYSGGSVWKAVELWRGNFTTAQKWVDEKYAGGSIWKAVELWRGNFSTVQKWIEDSYLGGKITKTVSVIASLTNAAALEKSIKDAISGITVKIKTTVNGKTSVFGQLKTSEYAQGGFPEAGELFIAREAGPELVGTMNGNAAVANNDQIVAGIQSGVAQANAEQNELLRQQNSILMQLLNKDLTITPSVALGQVVARSTALYGRA